MNNKEATTRHDIASSEAAIRGESTASVANTGVAPEGSVANTGVNADANSSVNTNSNGTVQAATNGSAQGKAKNGLSQTGESKTSVWVAIAGSLAAGLGILCLSKRKKRDEG